MAQTLKQRQAPLRHPKLVEIMKGRIGPLFPRSPDWVAGMRGTIPRKTKPPFNIAYRARRRVRNRIARRSRAKNRI